MKEIKARKILSGNFKITDKDVMGCKTFICNNCNAVMQGYKIPNFCSNCGIKFKEVIE